MMTKGKLLIAFITLVFCTSMFLPAFAQDKTIKLPQPKLDQSKSLGKALQDRKSSREFSAGDLSQQMLSNLLWAAWGINRADTGKRTAPSAFNEQEIEVYVATAQGMYRYDSKENALSLVVSEDLRSLTYTQSYAKDAAINLVYIADFSKMEKVAEADRMMIAGADAGFIGENVYLYCASEGLATVFRAGIHKDKLAAAMKLRPEQKIIFAQTVGMAKSGK
jgi:SagB-type dehydrogenase family enzyme